MGSGEGATPDGADWRKAEIRMRCKIKDIVKKRATAGFEHFGKRSRRLKGLA